MYVTTYDGKVGAFWGQVMIALCMIILGPLIVMPRIVMLSYELLSPFLPGVTTTAFSAVFMGLVLLATYRPGRVLDLIGRVLSPLKIAAIALIVAIGVMTAGGSLAIPCEPADALLTGLRGGYETLDLLGTIFFGSIIVSLLSRYAHDGGVSLTRSQAAYITGVSGIFAGILIALVYSGMMYLSAYHGIGLVVENPGQLFSALSFKILGTHGAALVGLTVFLACFTTSVSLTAVVSDYVQRTLFMQRITFAQAVILVLSLTGATASIGLSSILKISEPLISAFYPVLIAVTIANIIAVATGVSFTGWVAAVAALCLAVQAVIY